MIYFPILGVEMVSIKYGLRLKLLQLIRDNKCTFLEAHSLYRKLEDKKAQYLKGLGYDDLIDLLGAQK
jgi:hypothetical protein